MKSTPSGQLYYVYGPGRQLLAEYAGSFSKEAPWTGTTGVAPTATLTWAGLTDATFEVCVDTINNNACDTTWTDLDDATQTTLTDLAAGTYYWQVKALTSGGTTFADAGTWWSFTVNAQGIFGKTSPGGGAYVLTDNVTLAWNALPDVGYWVCWDTSDNDTCDTTWWPHSVTAKVVESLSAGTYSWQVRAWWPGNDVEADAGDWWTFTKVTGQTGKLAPLAGTANHGDSLWLSWSAVEDSGYWVCCSLEFGRVTSLPG
jgi:hypothetical protein